MNELAQFIKTHLQRSENGLMQVVLLNALSFFALLLLKIVLMIAGYESAYITLFQNLVLPSSWSAFLQQPWALLTHCWVHVSFFPTLLSLLLLYTLGQVVTNHLGSRHFVALYLLGGLAGGLLFLLLYNTAPYYQGATAFLSSFSGALYAVMVAAATLAPQRSFFLFLLGPLKLRYIVGFFVLLAVVNMVGDEPATSIAHLGGALLGYMYVKQCYGYTGLRRFWKRLQRPRKGFKVTGRRVASPVEKVDDVRVDQARLDHILDKVATSGYESLTPAEKQQLFNAGQ